MALYDSRADLVTRLTNIRTALDKVRTAQSYAAGQSSLQRANFRALLDEEAMILKKIEVIDNQSGGGGINLAEFNDVG